MICGYINAILVSMSIASNSIPLILSYLVGMALGVALAVRSGQRWDRYMFKQRRCMTESRPFLPEEPNPFTRAMALSSVSFVILIIIMEFVKETESSAFYLLIPVGLFLISYFVFNFFIWLDDKEKNKALYEAMRNAKGH